MTMKKLIAVMLVTGVFIGLTSSYGQTGQLARSPNVRLDPCPGGTATISPIDFIGNPSRLEDLIQLSDVILVGTVVEVLPATRMDPDQLKFIQTTSLISVNELLRGTVAPDTK